ASVVGSVVSNRVERDLSFSPPSVSSGPASGDLDSIPLVSALLVDLAVLIVGLIAVHLDDGHAVGQLVSVLCFLLSCSLLACNEGDQSLALCLSTRGEDHCLCYSNVLLEHLFYFAKLYSIAPDLH